jgi:hypothetical protein
MPFFRFFMIFRFFLTFAIFAGFPALVAFIKPFAGRLRPSRGLAKPFLWKY